MFHIRKDDDKDYEERKSKNDCFWGFENIATLFKVGGRRGI